MSVHLFSANVIRHILFNSEIKPYTLCNLIGSHFRIIKIIPGGLSKVDVYRSRLHAQELSNVMNLKIALKLPMLIKEVFTLATISIHLTVFITRLIVIFRNSAMKF